MNTSRVMPLCTSTPAVSIIIATFNARRTLQRCIDSIVEQSFPSWELIIIDGGSNDETQEIIRQNQRSVAYWHSKHDRGIYDAWNQGIGVARGTYICFLGADDAFADSDTLRKIFSRLGGNIFDLVSAQGQLMDADMQLGAVVGQAWNFERFPTRMGIVHPGLLHHRSLFDLYGRFDPTFRIAGDLDFLMRLPATARTAHLPWRTVLIQDDGISRKQFFLRIAERRRIHSKSPRVGPVLAWLFWLDKVWRMPIARALGLPH